MPIDVLPSLASNSLWYSRALCTALSLCVSYMLSLLDITLQKVTQSGDPEAHPPCIWGMRTRVRDPSGISCMHVWDCAEGPFESSTRTTCRTLQRVARWAM